MARLNQNWHQWQLMPITIRSPPITPSTSPAKSALVYSAPSEKRHVPSSQGTTIRPRNAKTIPPMAKIFPHKLSGCFTSLDITTYLLCLPAISDNGLRVMRSPKRSDAPFSNFHQNYEPHVSYSSLSSMIRS